MLAQARRFMRNVRVVDADAYGMAKLVAVLLAGRGITTCEPQKSLAQFSIHPGDHCLSCTKVYEFHQ